MDYNLNYTIDAHGNFPSRRFINPTDPRSGEWLYQQVKEFNMVGNTADWERGRVEAHLRMAAPYTQDELALMIERDRLRWWCDRMGLRREQTEHYPICAKAAQPVWSGGKLQGFITNSEATCTCGVAQHPQRHVT